MKTTGALLRTAGDPFEIVELDLAPPRRGEVLVRVEAAGVCHSDWHVATGATPHPMPVVAGHEGAGVVESIGDGVTRVQPGDHVALNWAPHCSSCFYCERGRPSLCATYVGPLWAGTMLDGTTRLSLGGSPVYHFSGLACFARRAVVPDVCCVPIDERVPFSIAALIGCAVTTGIGAVTNTVRVEAGASVAVWGAGGVGLASILAAKRAGADPIIAIDRTVARCELAEEFGATHSRLDSTEAVDEIRALTSGRGADYVFEAVGSPELQTRCLFAARPGGVVVLVGIAPVGSSTDLPGAVITREEKTIVGSYYGTANTERDFPTIATDYLEGRLELDRLVSRTYGLRQINEAYADLLGDEGGRGVIVL